MEPLLQPIARFAADLHFDDLPEPVVEKCKLLIIDSLGCTMGAWELMHGQFALQTARALGGDGSTRVTGTNLHVPLPWCIYANSYGCNVLDFDDVHPVAGHPGATIVPPAFALIQEHPCAGRDLVTSVVAAYEIGMRIAHAITPSPERAQQVIGFATWQIFTSALVAARLIGCDTEQTAQALAVAGTRAVVPYVRKSGRHERPYAWVKNNYGWTAFGGFLSAWQAQRGFRGNLTLLDGPNGFWVMAGSDQCEPEAFTKGLGVEFQILEVGVKPYPVCRHIHTALDGLIEIVQQHQLGCDDVESIEVLGSPAIADDFMVYEPVDTVDAQFSLPYAMAMVLLGYQPGYDWLAPERISEPEILREAKKVTARVDRPAAMQSKADWPVTVKVLSTTGKQFKTDIRIPRGHPERPLSTQEHFSKFNRLAIPVIGEAHSEELVSRVMNLENENTLSWISDLSTPI